MFPDDALALLNVPSLDFCGVGLGPTVLVVSPHSSFSLPPPFSWNCLALVAGLQDGTFADVLYRVDLTPLDRCWTKGKTQT